MASEPLHVLVYGSVDDGACDSVRLGVYRDLLPAHGVEMRTWGEMNDYRVQIPADYAGGLEGAFRDGVAAIDLSPLEWADVLVFRRWYGTVCACEDCDYVAPDETTLAGHAAAGGHAPAVPDRIVRVLLSAIEKDRSILRGRALVYEVDDDLLAAQPWSGFDRRLAGDRDLIERFARVADLVTVSTPAVAASFERFNASVRVIRNAVKPELYGPAPADVALRPLSFVYYGVGARYRDYSICRDAVDSVARAGGGRRIWIGSDEPSIKAVVDEARPYRSGVPEFARELSSLAPAIGLAPCGQDAYSRAHSELHWLEYSLAGAATVASRCMGPGPYDVMRDGVDGLLARNKAQWQEQLRRLAASPSLREELAGRARERVLAEYDVRDRVSEWADAFSWAAAHAGSRAPVSTRPWP